MGLDFKTVRPTALSLSSKPAPKSWKAHTFDAYFPVYKIEAREAKMGDVRNFLMGIRADNFIVLVELSDLTLLCMSRAKKGEAVLILPIRTTDDFERIVNVLRRHNFSTDELSAHVAIDSCIELLKSGAERHFINRGLFSSYFLRERLDNALSERKRHIEKEITLFLSKFPSGLPSTYEDAPKILNALGYSLVKDGESYQLSTKLGIINVAAVVVSEENLDVKSAHDSPVPSIQAVAQLTRHPWVILTNGKIWRLYSSRVSSASTNYFEIDIDDITDEKQPKLKYFISLFGSNALATGKDEISDVDFVFNGGLSYAKELEDDLRRKVFEKQLFLDLVKGIIAHSKSKKYSENQLQDAKKTALKLLYRILFILYAESRSLLPTSHTKYKEISFGSLRERLTSMGKEAHSTQTWNVLLKLFASISNGNPEANIPQYNGTLFEFDKTLDSLKIQNGYLVPALKELTLIEGKGIDYQNFGVRQLGSLYESLLDYTVKQAENDLVVIKEEILDFSFASDLKTKPSRVIEKGELYLSVAGLSRKGTGSYYTSEKIVKFLVQKGLEPIFQDREKNFVKAVEKWRRTKNITDALVSTKHLLDIQVVDPAMGSGHFLVVVVDEITRWIMSLLQRFPDAPLAEEIGSDRAKILSEQKNLGISLDSELLTFNVILKRKVMKRCVFGVDINPLAVELAKLSLWLDSFTIGTPLTFLDHHIRCGDSLIGLWVENLNTKKSGNLSLDFWIDNVTTMGNTLFDISTPADITLAQFKSNRESYQQFREKSKPLRVLLDMRTAAIINTELQNYYPSDLVAIEEAIRKNKSDAFASSSKAVSQSNSYSEKYRFFHWELEFPDAYSDERRGFDLVVMNPPWDAVKPEDDDFFSQYDRRFRKISNKQEKNKIKSKLLSEKSISKLHSDYVQSITDKLTFYKMSDEFVKRGSGDTDTWKLFLERAIKLTTDNGTLSIIIPSSIITNEGAKELRADILENRIRHLYEFENTEGIFPDVDSRYKFALIVVDKARPKEDFPAAFYLHQLDALVGVAEKEKFVRIKNQFIKLTSPETLTIPEVRGQKDIEILEKLYNLHPLLSTGIKDGKWKFKFVREMDRTNSSHLFKTDGKGWPLIEGKHFHQYIPEFEKPQFTIEPNAGLQWTSKIKEYSSGNKEIHNTSRLVFRNVASGTNIRTMISCILPKNLFLPHSASIVVPRYEGKLILNEEYYRVICYVLAIFNSYIFDYILRTKVTMNVSHFYLYQTPIPSNFNNNLGQRIVKLAARLTASGNKFKDLANTIGVELTPLSMKERIEYTAKLDCLVAHQYGASRKEYEHIVNSFSAFEEDTNIEKLNEMTWNDKLVKKFNGEVRKYALIYFDTDLLNEDVTI